uniref:Uncharacterized protein n=1 Tax=Ananas comosus var. bracteatus TaxID=296719 RepID=A0A6V7PS95_ANACO|nr:unnamed protein product [Ananas comosus var. bracteatus]
MAPLSPSFSNLLSFLSILAPPLSLLSFTPTVVSATSGPPSPAFSSAAPTTPSRTTGTPPSSASTCPPLPPGSTPPPPRRISETTRRRRRGRQSGPAFPLKKKKRASSVRVAVSAGLCLSHGSPSGSDLSDSTHHTHPFAASPPRMVAAAHVYRPVPRTGKKEEKREA